MEQKINIAEILKDCPKGTKLYSPLCGECRVFKIYDHLGFDVINGTEDIFNFSYDGRYNLMGECCIFPSKDQRDWSTFQRPFKDGDIISNGRYVAIFHKSGKPENCVSSNVIYYHCWYNDNTYDKFKAKIDFGIGIIKEYKYATEKEKQKLFDAINESGYRWNEETKTLEKLIKPKFKAGDRVKRKDADYTYIITITKLDNDYYDYVNEDGQCGVIHISKQDDWELVPNKFDITTLRPFDKVLVRPSNSDIWECDFFSLYNPKCSNRFHCIGAWYNMCIPYIGNEHLRGTTDDCDEYYKNWDE